MDGPTVREDAVGGIVRTLSSARARRENAAGIVSRDESAWDCRI